MSAEVATLPMVNRNTGGLKSVLVLVGIAAAVAAGVGVVLWSKEPTYSPLLSKVGNEEIAQVVQSLDSAGIPYKADTNSGSISVPAERLSEARLKLAGEGLPASGGFAAISKDQGFGTSQLMENVRYQYALELELAKTIAHLQSIEGARVHLAMPEQSAFLRDKRPVSASVFVQLKPGRRLENQQVMAIVNLVASSIPGLQADRVTVVDQQGRLLSSPEEDSDIAMRDKQYEFAHRLEDMYTSRIEQLLSPLVGDNNIRAQVVADVELAITEETREQYKPDSQVVRSEQTAEENTRGANGAQGVPGALTNQPPSGGTAAAPNVGTNDTTGQNAAASTVTDLNSSKQATRNYEIDRTLAYTKQLPGRLKRLTVAVLVDNLRATDADGKVTETPFTPEQLENMTRLVRDAVGFDEKRGDSVNVINASFRAVPAATQDKSLQTVALWEKPWVMDVAKLVLGLIVALVLILSVIRPLIRSLLANAGPSSAPPLPDVNPSQQLTQNVAAGAQAKSYEQQITDARAVVNQDPRRVAQVVKTWVSDNE